MESSLSLTLDDLTSEVMAYLGWGRDPTTMGADQAATVTSFIRSGLRNFYFPPPLAGMAAAHEWSFMRPTTELRILVNSLETPLPDDFGGMDGEMYYSGTTSTLPIALPQTGEGQIYGRRAMQPDATGRPVIAAVRPLKETTLNRGQRFELIYWPKPDVAYTLVLAYFVLPEAILATRPYHLGGMAHAETILQSCLAQAELKGDDAVSVHKAMFMERLGASISADRRMKPAVIGYNGDRSDGDQIGRRDRHAWKDGGITVNGIQY